MRWILAVMMALAVGCEMVDSTETDVGSTDTGAQTQQTTATTEQTATTAASGDSAEWDAIAWQGGGSGSPGAAKVMDLGASIVNGGAQVRFSFSSYPWGGQMGLCHFFVWDGSRWRGGKFDWIRAGGQGVKTLENVRGGYNGLRVPASGTPVAFAWTSANGRERSNLAKTTWP